MQVGENWMEAGCAAYICESCVGCTAPPRGLRVTDGCPLGMVRQSFIKQLFRILPSPDIFGGAFQVFIPNKTRLSRNLLHIETSMLHVLAPARPCRFTSAHQCVSEGARGTAIKAGGSRTCCGVFRLWSRDVTSMRNWHPLISLCVAPSRFVWMVRSAFSRRFQRHLQHRDEPGQDRQQPKHSVRRQKRNFLLQSFLIQICQQRARNRCHWVIWVWRRSASSRPVCFFQGICWNSSPWGPNVWLRYSLLCV